MEWTETTKYNPFNSYKGLTYYEHFKSIDKWLSRQGNLPPPLEASFDPIALCNLKCYYCNSQRYLKINPDEIPAYTRVMSKAYMKKLVDYLADWGVKGVCLGGGGEPMLNEDAQQLPSYIASRGMESAIVTNGTVMNDTLSTNMCYCKWVAFSVDAHDMKTYREIHGVNFFEKVCKNIQELVAKRDAQGSPVFISFRMLILPENVEYIPEACELAKSLGVDAFHVRPVDLQRKDYRGETYNFDAKSILKQFEKCYNMAGDKFSVFAVQHKYTSDLRIKHDFAKCLASPLVIQLCTDGKCYVCPDHRIEDRFCLGDHMPERAYAIERLKRKAPYPEPIIKDWWGSEAHRDLVLSIKPPNECGRCTWSEYQRQMVAIQGDTFHRSFP